MLPLTRPGLAGQCQRQRALPALRPPAPDLPRPSARRDGVASSGRSSAPSRPAANLDPGASANRVGRSWVRVPDGPVAANLPPGVYVEPGTYSTKLRPPRDYADPGVHLDPFGDEQPPPELEAARQRAVLEHATLSDAAWQKLGIELMLPIRDIREAWWWDRGDARARSARASRVAQAARENRDWPPSQWIAPVDLEC